ncbi:MAG TPA: hypothetical protein VES02_04325 [Dermatophilaceae bacterium]|nr:hypothetical protein [Dermatophilaceae bacterium]
MVKRAAVVSLVMTAGLIGALERYGRRSGATRAEGRMGLPGDEIVRRPLWQSTRAITIDATPDRVWPWIVQMGFPPHRAGWYTPHWLDVAMWGERPRSAARIMPELQALAVGETVPDSADYSVYYRVESVQPPATPQDQPAHPLLHSVRHVFGPLKESDFSW